ncbi:MAG: zinc-ribbon domain-containing protein [Actinobacteria bacterium]|nr:zinc-ribbon domain-containing protein [Actinomycetota bacterium]
MTSPTFCPNCGAPVPQPPSRFCMACGTELQAAAPQPAARSSRLPRWLWPVLGSVVLALVAVVVVLLMRDGQGKEPATTKITLSQERTIPQAALAVAYSSDGASLAVASGGLRIYKLDPPDDGRELANRWFTGSVAWSPNGRQLVTGSSDHKVRVWDSASGALLRTLTGHTLPVDSVAWSPDGRQLASGSSDWTVRVWDAASGVLLRTQDDFGPVRFVTWSPDGKRLASWGETFARVWDAASGALLRTLEASTGVAWSPNGRQLASGSHDGRLHVWDADSGALLRTLTGHALPISSVAWSPDGRLLASGSGDGRLHVWDADSGALLSILSGHTASLLAWSPDGRQLASGSGGGIVLWSVH